MITYAKNIPRREKNPNSPKYIAAPFATFKRSRRSRWGQFWGPTTHIRRKQSNPARQEPGLGVRHIRHPRLGRMDRAPVLGPLPPASRHCHQEPSRPLSEGRERESVGDSRPPPARPGHKADTWGSVHCQVGTGRNAARGVSPATPWLSSGSHRGLRAQWPARPLRR